MTDIRELRLAIERKLKHRSELILQNSRLHSANGRLMQKRDLAHKVMKSRVCQFALDDCADRIVNEILNRAMDASKTIAEQTMANGDYVIRIDIPSLHIKQIVSRAVEQDFDVLAPRPIRHISVKPRGNDHGPN